MGRYRNPLLPGCHPDPSICRVGDEYFLVTSTFEYLPGLPVHRSANLVDWELVGHVVHDELDYDGVPSSGGLYAPTIRHHDGRFFVVCTLVHGRGRQGHFVMTAEDPAGPWSAPVWLDGVEGIDPSLTFDGDRVWLCGTRLAEPGLWEGQTDVWLQELEPGTLTPVGPERLIWRGALDGARWAEGPHILPRPGGGWMLVAAEGGTAREHAVCVAYADDITGPYVGDPANPLLTHRDLGDLAAIVNVGHADLVDSPSGDTWAVLLATRAESGLDGLLGRQTHLVPVAWQDGRPLFAPGVARVEDEVEALGIPDQAPAPSAWRDDFGGPLDPGWNGVRRLPSAFAGTSDGCLVLAAGDRASDGFLGRRLPWTAASCAVTVAPRSAARAGLLLRASDDHHVSLAVDANGVARAIVTTADGESVIGEAEAAGADVRLRLDVDGFAATAWAGETRVAQFDVSALSTSRAGGFVGVWIGPFAAGAGSARFEAFELMRIGVDAEPSTR